jgi:hypothetical protein
MMIQFTFTLILFAFISGSALAVPTVSTDRELPVITVLSKLELELDARITYEVAKGSDAKLENVLRIEQELIASSGDKSNPSLLSRTLTLKHSILTLKAGNETTNIQSASSVGTGGFDRSEADTDGPTLNSISVNQTTVDVTDGPQSLIFTLDATDDSGIDWSAGVNDSGMVLQDAGGGYHYAPGNSDDPGKLSITISSDDKGGNWSFAFLALTDNLGNRRLFSASVLQSFGLPNSIEIIGGIDSDPPVLNAISVDKVTVDVTEGPQTLTFTVDATDESGVNWSAGSFGTDLVLAAGGTFYRAQGSDDEPGKLTISVDSSRVGGNWEINRLYLKDNLGNVKSWGSATLISLGLPAFIEVIGGQETDPPVLNAISVDRATIDAAEGPQTLTFTVDATDESGVNWSAGSFGTDLVLAAPGGNYYRAQGSDDEPGKLKILVDSSRVGGKWEINRLYLKDSVGNVTSWGSSTLISLGLPSFIYVLADGESTSDITLNADTSITNVSENSEINYSLKIENLASVPTGQLTFELKSTNVRVSAVSQAGSSACSISSINYNSTVSCALSGVDANTSKVLTLTLAPGISGTASFNANIVADIPDISYLNNYVSASLVVDPDGDGDGIADNTDNCPSDSNSDQLDTDSDGSGNACDVDDDNDNVLDGDDAFPLDATESVDTDSDGTGNNADTDDDGDGVIDSSDAYPLISLNGLTDTDLDGLPNDCDAACLDAGMTADTDDDGDGVSDNDDAFPLDATETEDSDLDGVGDNSDPFPNDALYSIDSDSDGMPDEWETRYGLDPNDASDATSDQDNDGVAALEEFLAGTIPSGSLDIDGNGQYDALTDGLLLLRGMFGLDDSALITGTIASDAAFTESVDIESRIATLGDLADIDGNGEIDALTDGLLTLRYLFGLEGGTLIAGVVASDATRTTAVDIEAHLKTLMPAL